MTKYFKYCYLIVAFLHFLLGVLERMNGKDSYPNFTLAFLSFGIFELMDKK